MPSTAQRRVDEAAQQSAAVTCGVFVAGRSQILDLLNEVPSGFSAAAARDGTSDRWWLVVKPEIPATTPIPLYFARRTGHFTEVPGAALTFNYSDGLQAIGRLRFESPDSIRERLKSEADLCFKAIAGLIDPAVGRDVARERWTEWSSSAFSPPDAASLIALFEPEGSSDKEAVAALTRLTLGYSELAHHQRLAVGSFLLHLWGDSLGAARCIDHISVFPPVMVGSTICAQNQELRASHGRFHVEQLLAERPPDAYENARGRTLDELCTAVRQRIIDRVVEGERSHLSFSPAEHEQWRPWLTSSFMDGDIPEGFMAEIPRETLAPLGLAIRERTAAQYFELVSREMNSTWPALDEGAFVLLLGSAFADEIGDFHHTRAARQYLSTVEPAVRREELEIDDIKASICDGHHAAIVSILWLEVATSERYLPDLYIPTLDPERAMPNGTSPLTSAYGTSILPMALQQDRLATHYVDWIRRSLDSISEQVRNLPTTGGPAHDSVELDRQRIASTLTVICHAFMALPPAARGRLEDRTYRVLESCLELCTTHTELEPDLRASAMLSLVAWRAAFGDRSIAAAVEQLILIEPPTSDENSDTARAIERCQESIARAVDFGWSVRGAAQRSQSLSDFDGLLRTLRRQIRKSLEVDNGLDG